MADFGGWVRRAFGPLWSFFQTPLGIAVFTVGIVGGIAAFYNDYQASIADRAARSAQLSKLLLEFQHRFTALRTADSKLDTELGSSPSILVAKNNVPRTCETQRRFEKLATYVGQQEQDIISGNGRYVATAPEFSHLNILIIGSQIDQQARLKDMQMPAIAMLNFLDTAPDVLWIFTRSQLPTFDKFSTSRRIFYNFGLIPLRNGQVLTTAQSTMLGYPDVQPGDLNRIERENDALHSQMHVINGPPDPCKR